MAEEHVFTSSIGGVLSAERLGSIMFRLWEFVTASAVINFATDTAVPAVFDGTSYGTPTNQTFFENDGARITVGPVDPTVDWQAKIELDLPALDLLIEYAPAGGWTNAGLFGASPTSGDHQWNDGAAPSIDTSLYVSAADGDGYPYFRVIMHDGTLVSEAFYVGGYIPIEPIPNTQPHCLLARNPVMGAGGSANSWGYLTPGTSNHSRVPVQYPPITTDLTDNGYAAVVTTLKITDGSFEQGYAGTFVQVPVFLVALSSHCLGYFGPFTMYGISTNKANGATDDSGEYIVFNDFAMRWNP